VSFEEVVGVAWISGDMAVKIAKSRGRTEALLRMRIYPFHLKDPKANRFKSSQIEEKNEVNIKLILTSFFCSILERFQFDFLGWL